MLFTQMLVAGFFVHFFRSFSSRRLVVPEVRVQAGHRARQDQFQNLLGQVQNESVGLQVPVPLRLSRQNGINHGEVLLSTGSGDCRVAHGEPALGGAGTLTTHALDEPALSKGPVAPKEEEPLLCKCLLSLSV